VIRPDPELVKTINALGGHFPRFVEWLTAWRQYELERLPSASADTVAIMQGRCQVLTELCKLVQDAPELVAQSKRGQRP
jgi:hypothetical protein